MTQQKKAVYVVLGMARSGTSVIANALQSLGINLGDQLIASREKWNPKGFFEDKEIVYKVNRRIMDKLTTTYMGIDLSESLITLFPHIKHLEEEALSLLSKRFEASEQWGFKDPRTAKLLPFWKNIFKQLHLQPYYLIALRHPFACASSYQRVTGSDKEVGVLLWITHMLAAIEETHHTQRVIVSYENILTQPQVELTRIKSQFQLNNNSLETEENFIKDFLDKKLQHFDDNLEAENNALFSFAPLAMNMYTLLKQVANDQITFDSDVFYEAWAKIKSEFAKSYPLYQYIGSLLFKNKQQERDLRTIQKSLPWKLAYPLRYIDDKLRMLRKVRRKAASVVLYNE